MPRLVCGTANLEGMWRLRITAIAAQQQQYATTVCNNKFASRMGVLPAEHCWNAGISRDSSLCALSVVLSPACS